MPPLLAVISSSHRSTKAAPVSRSGLSESNLVRLISHIQLAISVRQLSTKDTRPRHSQIEDASGFYLISLPYRHDNNDSAISSTATAA